MKALIPACAMAIAMAAAVHAQDNTVTSKTQVSADDARTVVATGCLQQAPGTKTFTLAGASMVTGEDLTAKTRVKTDVDKDDTTVKAESTTKVDRDDRAVGTSGTVKAYELSPRAGIDLSAHVGKQVEISAVMVDAAKGDDDAEVKIKEETRTKVDDAPDSKVESVTKAELPRGDTARLTVVSVKEIAASCN